MGNGIRNIASNPFTTGHGKVPPYLAGREDEKHKLYELLGRTVGGEVVTSNVHIVGPRGVGKTSLLEQMRRELKFLKAGREGKAALSIRFGVCRRSILAWVATQSIFLVGLLVVFLVGLSKLT